MTAPLDVLKERDPKGLYAAQARGELKGLTGVDAPYDPPGPKSIRSGEFPSPLPYIREELDAITIDTSEITVKMATDRVLRQIWGEDILGTSAQWLR